MKNPALKNILGISVIFIGVGCVKGQSAAIDPAVAVGPVHSGMTIRTMATTLGKPDQITILSDRSPGQRRLDRTNAVVDFSSGPPSRPRELEYTNLGLTIFTGFSNNVEMVQSVAINTPFSGKTKEGIGISSSRADIIRAYGQPTETKKPGLPNFEVLTYTSPKIKFALQDDKISAITTEFDLK